METADELSGRFEELKQQLKTKEAVAEQLGQLLNQHADGIRRHDQVIVLSELEQWIKERVGILQMMENEDKQQFLKEKFTGAAVGFIAGTAFSGLLGNKDPFSSGSQLGLAALNRTAPFGSVVIAIGKSGLPLDINILSLSKLARSQHRSELEIANVQSREYLLITSKTFIQLMPILKKAVSRGTLSLPIMLEAIRNRIPGIIWSTEPISSIIQIASPRNN